jgi:hypothetical protein
VPVRAIKTTAISILAIGLLAGSTVGVTAQDEEEADLATPSYYTWTAGEPTSTTEGTFDEDTGEMRGFVLEGIPVEASDPRASGVASIVINGNSESAGIIESRTYRIVNDEGAWVGTTIYVVAGGPSADEPDIQREMGVLVGEGGYAGLINMATSDYSEGSSGDGVILGLSMPPAAEPLAE